jgi:hypothetical protein
MPMPSEVKRASKALVNLASRSRIRKRNEPICSPRLSGGYGQPGWSRRRSGGRARRGYGSGGYVLSFRTEDIESTQRDRAEGEEVGGQQTCGLSPQKDSHLVSARRGAVRPSGTSSADLTAQHRDFMAQDRISTSLAAVLRASSPS